MATPELGSAADYWRLLFRLNLRQQKFIEAYLGNGGNATAAYQTAYGAANPQTAASCGSDLLKNPEVSEVLASARRVTAQRALDRYEVTEERITAQLARVAFADLREVMTWDETGKVTLISSEALSGDAAVALASIERRTTKQGDALKVQLVDRLPALKMLAQMRGLLRDVVDVAIERRLDDAALVSAIAGDDAEARQVLLRALGHGAADATGKSTV